MNTVWIMLWPMRAHTTSLRFASFIGPSIFNFASNSVLVMLASLLERSYRDALGVGAIVAVHQFVDERNASAICQLARGALSALEEREARSDLPLVNDDPYFLVRSVGHLSSFAMA
jgi:hypothetical protein